VAELKPGEPFGLDNMLVDKIDWQLALKRVLHDLRSDFIYAPHVAFIFNKAGDKLINDLKSDLKSGTFSPGVPLTIEVPKSFRIRVASPLKRLGPSFTRPGSVLPPRDRLLLQALADEAAPIVAAKTDPKRSFSHHLAPVGSASMFLPTRTCWSKLQKTLKSSADSAEVKYILKIDVANFFGSLNQHTLINSLADSGYPKALHSRLEAMLTSYTGDRSSRGILQGIYPTDLLGNFYLEPVDRFLADYGVASARYVDDIYVFVESVDAGDLLLRQLIPLMRDYDLVLNEAKSLLMPKGSLMTEEPDLEALFADAVAEISEQVDDEDFDADYGFQSEWDDDDPEGEPADEEAFELEATKLLFDSVSTYVGQEENIERFCLPLFSAAGSDYAIEHVLSSFKTRPSMSQIYCSYLSKFLDDEDVCQYLIDLLDDVILFDWQKIWILAALLQVEPAGDAPVKAALDLLRDANRHEALRAVAAIYVGRYGDLARRKALSAIYATSSPYIQAAIYFSSRSWPAVEKANAKANWGGHGGLNALLTTAMAKK
jgi:hypothetical protein